MRRGRLLMLTVALGASMAPGPRCDGGRREEPGAPAVAPAPPVWRDEAAARALAAERGLLVLTFVALGGAGTDEC